MTRPRWRIREDSYGLFWIYPESKTKEFDAWLEEWEATEDEDDSPARPDFVLNWDFQEFSFTGPRFDDFDVMFVEVENKL